MLIMMTICALLGALAMGLAYVFFVTRRDGKLAAIQSEVDDAVATVIRRADDANASFVRKVADGVPIEQAVAELHTERSSILKHDRTTDPWDWNSDDVQAFRKREISGRSEAVNRALLVPAAATFMLIIATTASVLAVCYHQRSQDGIVGNDSTAPATQTDTILPPFTPLPDSKDGVSPDVDTSSSQPPLNPVDQKEIQL